MLQELQEAYIELEKGRQKARLERIILSPLSGSPGAGERFGRLKEEALRERHEMAAGREEEEGGGDLTAWLDKKLEQRDTQRALTATAPRYVPMSPHDIEALTHEMASPPRLESRHSSQEGGRSPPPAQQTTSSTSPGGSPLKPGEVGPGARVASEEKMVEITQGGARLKEEEAKGRDAHRKGVQARLETLQQRVAAGGFQFIPAPLSS